MGGLGVEQEQEETFSSRSKKWDVVWTKSATQSNKWAQPSRLEDNHMLENK